jgi:hypothetical protein
MYATAPVIPIVKLSFKSDLRLAKYQFMGRASQDNTK